MTAPSAIERIVASLDEIERAVVATEDAKLALQQAMDLHGTGSEVSAAGRRLAEARAAMSDALSRAHRIGALTAARRVVAAAHRRKEDHA